MKNYWFKLFMCIGVVSQIAIPCWMLIQHHLILTRGEKVTVSVSICDPRDLFMGHYVRLEEKEHVKVLEGIKKNYLRYYCDQNYAKAINRESSISNAELDVRVWRGLALAETLRIDGMPAYEYVDKKGGSKSSLSSVNEEMIEISDIINIDADGNELIEHGRLVIRGNRLLWNKKNADEGFFLEDQESGYLITCEVIETYKEGICFLIRVNECLKLKADYKLLFVTQKANKNVKTSYRYSLFTAKSIQK